ncbi:tyrosine-type recombinase/integrase [Vibrio sp. 10N.261.52.C11]|uniref:tyrosine-type recombinase/integrase n=1 Tax=unclassified Vibrio TaxID=2614977 RepID=UPI00354C009F
MAISDSKLKALSGKKHDNANPIKIADRDGLYAFHYKTGKVSFVLRYRYNKKQYELKLGSYPATSLLEARTAATEHQKHLDKGLDPKVQAQLQREKTLEAVTVRDALEHWIDNDAVKKRANFEKHRAQFKKHIYPFIGRLPLELCETRHWVQVFDDITNGAHSRPAPKASGYILQNAKQALRFCRNRQFAYSTALEDLNIADIGEHQNKKDRVLSWPELMEAWEWCDNGKNHWYYRNLVRLLVVFGCRTQELRLSKIKEWDLDSMLWTVPKSNSKTGSEIKRPIPIELESVIRTLVENSKNEFLLGEEKRPEAVSAYGAGISKKLGHEKWNLHDLRRSFATHLNDMEIEPYVVEQMLGHALGGVMAIYNRSQHIEKKRAALDLWLSKLTDTKQQSNVVGFK